MNLKLKLEPEPGQSDGSGSKTLLPRQEKIMQDAKTSVNVFLSILCCL